MTMPNLPDHIRDAIEVLGLSILILANLAKIASMQRHTERWNGLGRALRFEKAAYVGLFLWIMLMDEIAVLDHGMVFLAIAVWIVVAEIRTIRYTPHVWIKHDRKRGPLV